MRQTALRWGLAAAIVVATLWGAVSVSRTAISESMLYLASQYPLPPQVFLRAYQLAPENPDASYRLALYNMDVAAKPDHDAAGRLLDESVSRGPNRFQAWLAMGRNQEARGDVVGAEAAYRSAAALAPSYWQPQWALGNLYVREGRIDEGVAGFERAASQNEILAPLAVSTVWRATGGDIDRTIRSAGASYYGRTMLLQFLLTEQQTEAAIVVWRALEVDFSGNADIMRSGEALAGSLRGAGRTDEALEIWSKVTPEIDVRAERLRNADFEAPVAERSRSPFEWTVVQSQDAKVSVDVGRSGGKALRVDYAVKEGGSGLSHATQYVHARPGRSFVVSFWARTTDLQSGGPAIVSVSDASGREAVAGSQPLPTGTSEWTEYRFKFVAPSSGLVAVNVGRTTCGSVCPIFGSIWIDDFSLVAD